MQHDDDVSRKPLLPGNVQYLFYCRKNSSSVKQDFGTKKFLNIGNVLQGSYCYK